MPGMFDDLIPPERDHEATSPSSIGSWSSGRDADRPPVGMFDDLIPANKSAPADFDGALSDFDAHAGEMKAKNAETPQAEMYSREPTLAERFSELTGFNQGYANNVAYNSPSSIVDRLKTGAYQMPIGVAQAIPHSLERGTSLFGYAPNAISRFFHRLGEKGDAAANEAEQRRQSERAIGGYERGSTDPVEVAGDVLSPLNFGIGGGVAKGVGIAEKAAGVGENLISRLTRATTTGGAIMGAHPVTDADKAPGETYGDAKTRQIGTGAATGAILEGIATGLAPKSTPEAHRLIEKGVPLTIGETTGGPLKYAEDAAANSPLLGTAVEWAQNRSLQGFNRAAVNEALAPIEQKIGASTAPGREAFAEANQRIAEAYDGAFMKMNGRFDDELQRDIAAIRKTLPSRVQGDFDDALKRTVETRVDSSGEIAGRDLSRAMTDLRSEALARAKSPDDFDKRLGLSLYRVFGQAQVMAARHNPASVVEPLANINDARIRLFRLEKAIADTAPRDKIITPKALSQTGSHVSKDDVLTRERLMQPFAEDSAAVMRRRLPETGLAGRAAGLLGIHATHLATAGTTVFPEIGLATMYSPPAQNVLRALADSGYDLRNTLAAGTRDMTATFTAGRANNRPRSEREWQKMRNRLQAGGRP